MNLDERVGQENHSRNEPNDPLEISFALREARSLIKQNFRSRLLFLPRRYRKPKLGVPHLQASNEPSMYMSTNIATVAACPMLEPTYRAERYRLPTLNAFHYSASELQSFLRPTTEVYAPLVLDIHFSTYCTLNCRYCFTAHGTEDRYFIAHEVLYLSVKELKEIIAQFAQLGGRTLLKSRHAPSGERSSRSAILLWNDSPHHCRPFGRRT